LVVYENGKVVFQQIRRSPKSNLPGASLAANPVPVSPEDARAGLMQPVEPRYPEQAKRQHIQGPVVLKALVGKEGTVRELRVISGDPRLVVAAMDAVRQWRFKPYHPNGQPVEFETQITINFTLASK
jgi:TonB family protein